MGVLGRARGAGFQSKRKGGKIGTSALILILDISQHLIRLINYMCNEIIIIIIHFYTW